MSVRALLALLILAIPLAAGARPAERPRLLTARSAADPRDIALGYVHENRSALGLAAGDLDDWVVTDRVLSSHNGVTHVYVRQRLRGIEVFNASLSAAIDPQGRLVSLHQRFVRDLAGSVNARGPRITASEAVGHAAAHLGLALTAPLAPLEVRAGPALWVRLSSGGISSEPIPVKLEYFPVDAGAVRLAWNLVIRLVDGRHWWDLHVDAVNGEVLSQNDWIARDSYRVRAPPLESPGDGVRTLEVDPADPIASPFGWHDINGVAGAEFTDTRGNNVSAQEDTDANDVGGARPQGGAALLFDSPLDPNFEPSTYQDASITNVFYWNNLLHDVFYRYGFDEPAGNFQQNNYGRGGLGTDPVFADVQDGADENNAGFGTPPDGSPPIMELYLWLSTRLIINTPPGLAGSYEAGRAVFGAVLQPDGLTSDVVQALDAANAAGPSTTDACSTLTNDPNQVLGKIALIDRGDCFFVEKVLNAQIAGFAGAIVTNNVGNPALITMAGEDPAITIPSVFIPKALGDLIKADLPGVQADLVGYVRDSGLDNTVIVHEYGHGVSTRLTNGPSSVSCLFDAQSGGMGEGWSDWWGLVFTAKPGQKDIDPRGASTYVIGGLPTGIGIRTFPYSTDMAVNPLTYEDLLVRDEVHDIGEIWAVTLWQLYWNLVNAFGLDPDLIAGSGGNNLALELVGEGLKSQPCDPTFLDARDAILAADLQPDESSPHFCRLWDAFARRGIGLGADDGGSAASRAVTESFVLPASCTLCGDVDDSEVVDVVDAVAEARALAMLAPPMVAPEKCNVVGATDPADGDMDGLPDDCDSSDLATLRDHLAELTPGIGSVCEPAVGLAP